MAKDERFSVVQKRVKNRTELFNIMKEKVAEFSADEILDYMHHHFVPCGEIMDMESVFKSPMAQELVRTEMIDGVETKRVTGIAFRSKK